MTYIYTDLILQHPEMSPAVTGLDLIYFLAIGFTIKAI